MCQVPERQDDDLQPETELTLVGGAADHEGRAVQLLPRRAQAEVPAAGVRVGRDSKKSRTAGSASLRSGCCQEPSLSS